MNKLNRLFCLLLSVIIVMLSFVFSSSAATVESVKIVSLPDRTTFYKGVDWDYGYWDDLATGKWAFYTDKPVVSFLRNPGSGQYGDRGMLDMTGLKIKVTLSDDSIKYIDYNEAYNSNSILVSNIYFAISAELVAGENKIYVYLPSNKKAYDIYTVKLLTEKEPEYAKGDVNMNGIVNSADAALTLAYSVGDISLTDAQKELADLNSDGHINSNDALIILRKSVGLE